jgi:FkbM family methyltransferase
MKETIRKAARRFGYEVRHVPCHDWYERDWFDTLDLFNRLREADGQTWADFLPYVSANYARSHAQLFQDLFVLHMTGEKKDGYFVEFGATNGVDLSNSYLLETVGWSGLVAEPSKGWHQALIKNRKCSIDLRCVWDGSGQTISFSETSAGEFSTVAEFRHSDHNNRSHAKEYTVETVSLNDLLEQHKAPSHIDYLSIDTEGSEHIILRALDFKKWTFGIITVEHNFAAIRRQQIHGLLSDNGYRRVFEGITKWDDWYVRR